MRQGEDGRVLARELADFIHLPPSISFTLSLFPLLHKAKIFFSSGSQVFQQFLLRHTYPSYFPVLPGQATCKSCRGVSLSFKSSRAHILYAWPKVLSADDRRAKSFCLWSSYETRPFDVVAELTTQPFFRGLFWKQLLAFLGSRQQKSDLSKRDIRIRESSWMLNKSYPNSTQIVEPESWGDRYLSPTPTIKETDHRNLR